jgi:hypothetical protein
LDAARKNQNRRSGSVLIEARGGNAKATQNGAEHGTAEAKSQVLFS